MVAPVTEAATELKYEMFVHTVLYVFQIKDVSQFVSVLCWIGVRTMQVYAALHHWILYVGVKVEN